SDWKYVVLIREPHHFDPESWPKRDILTVYLLFAFTWFYARRFLDRPTGVFLQFFGLSLAGVFSLGLLCRVAERFELVKFFPFRLFPLLIPLIFLLCLAHAFQHGALSRMGGHLLALGCLGLLCLHNPIGSFIDQARGNAQAWVEGRDDLD